MNRKQNSITKALQGYLTYHVQRKGQPLHVNLKTPKRVETLQPEESEETSKESTAEAETIPTSSVEQGVLKSVPSSTRRGQGNCWIKSKNIEMC